MVGGAGAPKFRMVEPSYYLIPGSVPLDNGPDGNSIFLDAAPFIDQAHHDYVTDAAGYYLESRLRSSPERQQKYCRLLR
jgi:hypothetical protein